MKKSAIYTKLFIITGILVLINILANRLFLRLDFTADKRYTLSQATKDILENLPGPVTIKAFFSDNLPPNIAKTKRDFREQLVEFSQRSGGNIVYEFINPNVDEAAEMKAQQEGISPILVDIRERDQIKQQRAYLGAVLFLGDKKEIIPVVQPGAAMEYALATTLKKLSINEKPKIALLQGHGEPSKAALAQAIENLEILYEIDELTLDSSDIADEYRTLIIIDPQDTIPPLHLRLLKNYKDKGKNIFVAFSRIKGDLQNAYAQKKNTGMEELLKESGINVEENAIRDIECGSVTVQQQSGFLRFNSQVKFPYFPIISKFEEHPVTKGLEAIILPFASPISYAGIDTSKMKVFPLLMSSAKSGVQKLPFYMDISQQWTEEDFNMGSMPVAVGIESKISSDKKGKMVVVSNGNFATNGEGRQAQQVNPDNVNFMVNAIDWLSDDTGLIELRTKGITSRPLDQIEDGDKSMIKYANVFAPLILILIYGLIRYQIQNRRRQKWLEENH